MKGIFTILNYYFSPGRRAAQWPLATAPAAVGDRNLQIATHSPILLAYPDAQIYNLNSGIERIEYAETEQYKLTKNFLDNPNIFIERLFDSDFSPD